MSEQPTANAPGDTDDPVLRLSNVFQHVNGRCALDGVSLSLWQGEGLLLIGPNGAGKSLLVRLILGLDNPSAGQVELFGEQLDTAAERRIQRLRLRVGAVLQGGSLLDGLTLLENLLLPLQQTAMDREAMTRAARLVMTQLQLDGMENRHPRGLSLGQRRRAELARAMIHRPQVLVWDGLTDGLDLPAVRDIIEVLRVQQQSRSLAMIATDNSTLDAILPGDRVAVLDRGRLIFDGTRSELEQARDERLELRYILEGHP
jgi:ABC-type multidrug transport system ATPase subunit